MRFAVTMRGRISRLVRMQNITITNPSHTSHTSPADIRRATPADIGDIGRVLASAFISDPVFAWCVPDRARREQILPVFFELVASALLPHDEVHVDASGRGVALWVPPGEPTVLPDEEAAFQGRLAELLGPDAERTFTLVELMESNHPSDPHHYLWFVGVDADAQGGGIGSALLTSMLDRCDRIDSPAYLEATSEGNRRLYARHGFEVTRELSVGDSPTLWAMWRDPVGRPAR